MSNYSKDHPFFAPIIERYPLCAKVAEKQTYHISCDLTGSGLKYNVGDSVAILPENEKEEVEKIIAMIGATGDEMVEKKGQTMPLRELLRKKVSLDTVTQKLFAMAPPENHLKELKENLASLKVYLEARHVWDFLEEAKFHLTAQQLVDGLLPLMPRFYSVASSQEVVGDRVDLTVADVEFTSNGHLRRGVCSQYICHKMRLFEDKIPLFIQHAHAFALPEDLEAPIIMIGPGTGVAPYRGFMQERVKKGASRDNWLFFGERSEEENFFYQSYWEELVQQGSLKLTTAFSRDQAHKIYVQHRMKEHGEELFSWIDRGAYIYVCGDAKRMAKDVESSLLEIIEEFGGKNSDEAKAYLKNLRVTKKYQRDVY